jgi:hypothetical protein
VLVDNSKTSTMPGDSFVDGKTTGVTSNNKKRDPVTIDEKELIEDDVELI